MGQGMGLQVGREHRLVGEAALVDQLALALSCFALGCGTTCWLLRAGNHRHHRLVDDQCRDHRRRGDKESCSRDGRERARGRGGRPNASREEAYDSSGSQQRMARAGRLQGGRRRRSSEAGQRRHGASPVITIGGQELNEFGQLSSVPLLCQVLAVSAATACLLYQGAQGHIRPSPGRANRGWETAAGDVEREQLGVVDNLAQDVWVRLAPSRIHGVGVVALRDIPKGIDLFRIANAGPCGGEADAGVIVPEVLLVERNVTTPVMLYLSDFFHRFSCQSYRPGCPNSSRALPTAPGVSSLRTVLASKEAYGIPTGGINSMDVSFYLNHAPAPYANAAPVRRKGCRWARFVTLRAISAGEEITFDYSVWQDSADARAFARGGGGGGLF